MITDSLHPLIDLEEDLIETFTVGYNEYSTMGKDEINSLILMSNDCYIGDDPIRYIHQLNDEFRIMYIKGAKGNDVCQYFDYYILQGVKTFVVFIDSLIDTIDFSEPKNEIQKEARKMLGKSNFFDALAKLAEEYNLITQDATVYCGNSLSATALAGSLRRTPYIFAASIIDRIFTLSDNDMSCNIPYETMLSIIRNDNNKIKNYLGIITD